MFGVEMTSQYVTEGLSHFATVAQGHIHDCCNLVVLVIVPGFFRQESIEWML